MKWMLTFALATALTGTMAAEDKYKEKHKFEGKDPVTGQKIEGKRKVQVDEDGDHKSKTKLEIGDKTIKTKERGENDGDYKRKVKIDGDDVEYKSKVKIDK